MRFFVTVSFAATVIAFVAGCGGTSSLETGPSSASGTIYRQGTVQLQQTFTFDLDSGALADPGADIWFQAATADQNYLSPVPGSGAALGVVGQAAPGFAGCTTAKLSTASIPIDSLTAGTYVCATTSEGRIAALLVIAPVSGADPSATITIAYVTYNK